MKVLDHFVIAVYPWQQIMKSPIRCLALTHFLDFAQFVLFISYSFHKIKIIICFNVKTNE